MKNVYFISETVPHNNYGSFIIFYRHLYNLNKTIWSVSLIVPKYPGINNEDLVPGNWKITSLPNRVWFYPPYRKNSKILRAIRYWLMFYKVKNQIEKEKPDIIINYISGNLYSGFAATLAKKYKIPLLTFLHDDPILLNAYEANNKSDGGYDSYTKMTIAKSDLLLSVSKGLARSVAGINPKSEVLLPIAHEYADSNATWSDLFLKPTIGFAGKISKFYLPLFELTLKSLKKTSGKLIIVTDEVEMLTELSIKFRNLQIVPSFGQNEEVLNFFSKNVSSILVGYPDNLESMPWIRTCFPSKFIEFTQTRLPVIIISPEESAFQKWSRQENLKGSIESYTQNAFEKIFEKLVIRDQWELLAQQSKYLAEETLSPQKIQKEFERIMDRLLNKND